VCQNGINTNLRHVALGDSAFLTACVSFSIGLAAISAIAIAHGQLRGVRRDWSFRDAPWYAYLGGVVGPVYVVIAIFLAEQLGFATFQLCTICGRNARPAPTAQAHPPSFPSSHAALARELLGGALPSWSCGCRVPGAQRFSLRSFSTPLASWACLDTLQPSRGCSRPLSSRSALASPCRVSAQA
jgi:hypothetical protein